MIKRWQASVDTDTARRLLDLIAEDREARENEKWARMHDGIRGRSRDEIAADVAALLDSEEHARPAQQA